MNIRKKAFELHEENHGKIQISLKDKIDSIDKISAYYSPGVGYVSSYTHKNPQELRRFSWVNNLVAVVSDGSAVLGLGNLGPYGAMPVMEGKALLFKHLAGIDSVPIVLDTQDQDTIVEVISAIAPSFGAINLEDISAPKCFEIEEALKNRLKIPVMHDDQHGTAVVVAAGLINATKITDRNISDCKIVIIGAGAAGVAISKILNNAFGCNISVVDSKGELTLSRKNLPPHKQLLAELSGKSKSGTMDSALKGADVVIGVSQKGILKPEHIKMMSKSPIVFALANPDPEILPAEALKAGASVVATGRSDFPNQINNALAFPGIFRGALDNKVNSITEKHKIDAAYKLASLVKNPSPQSIVPSITNPSVVRAVSSVII